MAPVSPPSRRERRLYGHRGAPGRFPENTLESFRQALSDGATALEMDVHLTRDGQVVVAHDPDGRRMAGIPRAIADCPLDEVRTWSLGVLPDASLARVPTFDDVLKAFPGVRLNVDIKPRNKSVVGPILDVIRRNDAELRVTLASFHDDVLARVRTEGYRGELSLSPWQIFRLQAAPSLWLHEWPPLGDAVQVPVSWRGLRMDTPGFIDRCHSFGLRLDYWVVNDPAEAARLMRAGADGIMSDRPDLLVEAVLGRPRS
jgi:glycerophosphoryl diester phosphodiesterase